MRFHLRLSKVTCCLGVLLAFTGCWSSSTGSAALTDDKVKDIRKGVTTRAEIESMFGPPEMASIMAGGKRVLHYQFSHSNTHANAAAWVPFVGAFIGGSEGQLQVRTLQVIIGANGVVEDYEFNDTTTDMSRGSWMSGSSQSTTVAGKSQSPAQ